MKAFLTILFTLGFLGASAQQLYFPPLNGSDWETLSPEELGWCSEKLDSLLQFVEAKNTKAFLILKDGRIVVEQYYGAYTQDSAWYWASAGKSLMGVMIGLAQEDGYLDIEEPTSNYLGAGWTACPPEKEALIRIRHQISMSTGLDDSLEPPGSADNCFDPECFQYLADAGTRWAYHNSAYRIVQDVMETATGQNKNIYTRLRLGNRIGMKGFWFDYIYYSTARDMARFGLFTLARGAWNGDIILSDTTYFNAMANSSQAMNPSYGYLWWLNGKSSYLLPGLQFVFPGSLIPEAPADLIAALGKNDQKIYVVPSEGLVVVRQGESAGGVSPASSSFDNQLWARIMDLPCTTASHELDASLSMLQIAPNPATNTVQISAPSNIQEARLYSANGQLLRCFSAASPQLNASVQGLAPGLYLIQVLTEKGVLIQRLVVRG
ncbi:MAG: serine hydrolase [Phaeodactylibacter sp.]|nr:serine hydrolase [Phaeodactylibacter sp.]MCB9302787.1 serine hydrolase [Lewinellaceae bacterium]